MSQDPRTTALPSWVAFLAAGLCFVAAGYLAATSIPLGDTAVPGLARLPGAPWVVPGALIATGLTLLVCARMTPDRAALWRALTYPTAVLAVLLACGLCGAQVLEIQQVAGTLRAAPYLEGAPLPLTAPAPAVRATSPPTPGLPTNPSDLVALLGDPDPTRRQAAVDALLELGPEALPALQDAIDAPQHGGRALAAQTLGQVLEQEPVPSPAGLLALLDAVSPSQPLALRQAAARALIALDDLRTVGALIALVSPDRPDVQMALLLLTGKAFSDPIAAAAWWSRRRWAYGPQLGPQPELPERVSAWQVRELIAAFDPSSPVVCEVLSDRLVALGPASAPALVEALTGTSGLDARGHLALVLARILAAQPEEARPQASMQALLRVLADHGPDGALAARGLATLADPRTVAAQVQAFDPDDPDRVHALEVMSWEVFTSRDAARAWWEAHRRGYPDQLVASSVLTQLSSPGLPVGGTVPPGAVLSLEGWFAHDCPDDDCRHEDVEVTLDEQRLLVLAAQPEVLLALVPAEASEGTHLVRVVIAGEVAGVAPLQVVSLEGWKREHPLPPGEAGDHPVPPREPR